MNVGIPLRGGWIEVICGSMFSGKSEELIKRLRRARIARQNVQAFKPRLDDRYGDGGAICSHTMQEVPCELVENAPHILQLLKADTQVVGIDEVQFLGPEVVQVAEELATRGIRVICAGLDQDYRGIPWHPMPELLARAEYVEKTHAICVICGAPATRTQRKISGESRVLIGSQDLYEARCRACHTVPDETGEQTVIFHDDPLG